MLVVRSAKAGVLEQCRCALPRRMTVVEWDDPAVDDWSRVGCVVIVAEEAPCGRLIRSIARAAPCVSVSTHASPERVDGLDVPRVDPSSLGERLLPAIVAARTAWHWGRLVAAVRAPRPSPYAALLPAHVDRVNDVNSLARSLRLSRSGLHWRCRTAADHAGTAISPKALVDWILMMRLANARYSGATWEDAAALIGISRRSLWRLHDRMRSRGMPFAAAQPHDMRHRFVQVLRDRRV